MKLILSTLLFIFSSQLLSQVSIDFVGGAHSSYRIIHTIETPDHILVQEPRETNDKSKINYLIGFNLNARLNNFLDFKTGIRYFKNGYHTDYFGNSWRFCDVGIVPNPERTFIQNRHIEIPIVFRLKSQTDKELKPFVELGVAPSYLYSENIAIRTSFGLLPRP